MKNAQEKLQKIDNICNRNFVIALLIMTLVGIPIFMHSIMAQEPYVNVWVHVLMVLSASLLILLPVYYITVMNAHQWEKLFLKEFPGINAWAIKETVERLNTTAGHKHSFSSIARSVVHSMTDDTGTDNSQ